MSWTRRVLRRGEGQLWFAGVALWALILVEVAAVAAVDLHVAKGMALGIAAEVFTGRESGIPIALAAGVPRLIVFQVSATQDIGSALLVYPLFLLALHKWQDKDNYIMRKLRRIEAVALEHEKYVHRWGPLAIAVFMLVPFLINGPMLGLILGRLAGIYTRYVLPAVVAATVVAAAAWTFAFDAMITYGQRFHPLAGWYIAAGVAAVVVTLMVVDMVRERRGTY